MSENENFEQLFEQLFEQSLKEAPMLPGAIVAASVKDIVPQNEPKYVVVDGQSKSESYIPIEQFYDVQGHLEVAIGDTVNVVLEMLEDGFGNTRFSRERAKRLESWAELEQAYEEKKIVLGTIIGRVKGGFTVEVNQVRTKEDLIVNINKVKAFLPGSLVDVKPVHHPEALEGGEFEFKVIKVDPKRNNIVVSRRAMLEAESNEERASLLRDIHEKDELTGVVKNVTDYGVFVDLGGVDGLLHITDISWKRITHPGESFYVGQEIKVVVLRVDRKNVRVSLGYKQLKSNPWVAIAERYPIGTEITGRVTNIAEYGAFVEIEDGIEGLVHASEMDWTNKNVNPGKMVYLGQEVKVVVLNVDPERRRISLGMKQCTPNPWEAFALKYQKRQKIAGKIKSITDFGIFLELEGNIDGLVYLSDIAWNEEESQEKLRQYQKGEELSVMILAIDVERERIALGLKQLGEDALAYFLSAHGKDSLVSGTVVEVQAQFIMVDLLEGGVQGILHLQECAEVVEDMHAIFKLSEPIEAKVIDIDRKFNAISLSCKPKEEKELVKKETTPSSAPKSAKAENASVIKKKKASSSESGLKATLGDLFKDHMR